jgi:hypothetical protein
MLAPPSLTSAHICTLLLCLLPSLHLACAYLDSFYPFFSILTSTTLPSLTQPPPYATSLLFLILLLSPPIALALLDLLTKMTIGDRQEERRKRLDTGIKEQRERCIKTKT